jgi:hypothetical protein
MTLRVPYMVTQLLSKLSAPRRDVVVQLDIQIHVTFIRAKLLLLEGDAT